MLTKRSENDKNESLFENWDEPELVLKTEKLSTGLNLNLPDYPVVTCIQCHPTRVF